MAPDGDPEDALIIGADPGRGEVVNVAVHGRVLFEDAGLPDHKWICGEFPPGPRDVKRIERFFTWYALAKRCLYYIRGVAGGARFMGVEQFPPPVG